MSRKRLSDEVKAAKGTLRTDRAVGSPSGEPASRANLSPPSYFTQQERNIFFRLVDYLGVEGLNVIRISDSMMLEEVARIKATMDAELETLREEGNVIETPTTKKKNPRFEVVSKLSDQYHRLIDRLGLTPAGRNAVSAIELKGEDEELFDSNTLYA